MPDWEMRTVGSLCSSITSGGTPSRRQPEYYGTPNNGIPWLKTKELNDGYLYSSEEYISRLGLDNSAAKVLAAGTVLMAMYGATVGKLGILGAPMACNQAFCAMSVDPGEGDNRFLFYRLLHDRRELVGLANGAAQQNLSAKVIREFRFPCPPLPAQRRIAAVLGALDDLIETNKRLMARLDALCQAAFRKAWDGETHVPVSRLGEVTMGQSPPGKSINTEGLGTAFHQGTKDFGDTYPDARTFAMEGSRRATDGDVLISVRAPVGRVNIATEDMLIGRGLAALRSAQPASAYEALRAAASTLANFGDTGTVFAGINGRDLRSAQVPFADRDTLEPRLTIFRGMHRALWDECRAVLHARDELLPLLMSGRVLPGEVDLGV